MKVNHSALFCLLGALLSLLCLQVSLAASAVGDSNHRFLDATPNYYYNYVKEWKDTDNSLHYLVEYKGKEGLQNSPVVKNVELVVSFHDKNTFRVKILDHDNKRWEIPEQSPYPHFTTQTLIPSEESCCEVKVEKDPCFSFTIVRKDTHEVLFDTKNRDFLFSEFYIELSTALPSDNVYGFGERYYKFKLSPGIYTIWGRDDPMIIEDGSGGGNTYSHHPVGLFKDKSDNFFLTLMRNSNAMDVIVQDRPSSLTYKMVGGVIDLIFFVGDKNPETVLKSYHNYLGNFTMMPFWSMGFHQSKWGYSSHSIMNDVVNKYNDYDIPLDVIWSDIDYMIDKEIFTINTYQYPPEKMRELTTKYKKKWVPIIDPGVRIVNPQGPGTKEGLSRDIFLKNHQGNVLSGYVWPGRVYFPDFFHPKAEQYWADMLDVLYKIVPFAGIWLDMNEVANFVDGEEHRPMADSKYDSIPYTPGKHPLRRKTLSLDAMHHGGVVEYDAHGLFSLLENYVTHKYLQSKSKLPFILTRSTSMGVGKYAAHWTGDNGAHWNFLKDSIAGNFNFQIFGIPFVGADICGFMDGTNEELCARWTQLGALYPFARNHHEDRTRNQEPWTFTGNNNGISVLETTKIALKTRYSMLKWYYSLFIETGGAGSVFRPLLFEFPEDQELYHDGYTDWEFLLGKGLLCTPKVEAGDPVVEAYFPKATWFSAFTGQRYIDKDASNRVKKVNTPYNATVPMFLRAGHTLYKQKVDHVLSTEDLNNEFELIAALEEDPTTKLLTASGFIMGIKSFDDDSVHDRCMQDNCLYQTNVIVSNVDFVTAKIEITFKRQKQDVRVSLDSFGLYGLSLYGLPLEFMAEDESKIGSAFIQLIRNGQEVPIDQDLVDAVSNENRAFIMEFTNVLNIQDGDVLKLDLAI